LKFINSESFVAQRTLRLKDGERALDFGVNEGLDLLYVLAVSQQQTLILREFRLGSENIVRQTDLPSVGHANVVSMSISPNGETIALHGNVLERTRTRNEIILCFSNEGLACKLIATKTPISQAFFADNNTLLLVSSEFADRRSNSRKQCIEEVSLPTLNLEKDVYCRPGYGVHYAFGLGGDFVVAYSGYASYSWLTENAKVMASTLSVWDRNSHQLISISQIPEGPQTHQSSTQIRVDASGRRRFLFFNAVGGVPELLLYDLGSK
jgi:hypothetical protein